MVVGDWLPVGNQTANGPYCEPTAMPAAEAPGGQRRGRPRCIALWPATQRAYSR